MNEVNTRKIIDLGSYETKYGNNTDLTPKKQKTIVNDKSVINYGSYDFDSVDTLFQQILCGEKDAPKLEEVALLLSTSAKPTSIQSEKFCQIVLESGVEAYFNMSSLALSLFESGRTTGFVCNCGFGTTEIVPIFEMNPLLTSHYGLLCGGNSINFEIKKLIDWSSLPKMTNFEKLECIDEIKKKNCFFTETGKEDIKKFNLKEKYYELDLSSISDIFFEEKEIDLYGSMREHRMNSSIQNEIDLLFCELDKDLHEVMWDNFLLSGGNSRTKGFQERLRFEVEKKSNRKVKMIKETSETSAWEGGKLLTSLPEFQKLWITKDEYDEYGPTLSNICSMITL
eukprot:gene6428-10436_t